MQDKYGLRPRKVPKTKHKWLKRSLITIGILLLTVTVIFGSGAVYLLHINSKYTETVKLDLAKSPITQNIKIVDKNNQILSESTNRAYYVPSTIKGDNKNIPDLYLKALLATEDHNFYNRKTKGYDIKGMASAFVSAVKSKLGHGAMRGGSTIDQQVVKTLMLGGSQAEESLQRKIVELLESHEMARTYSRDEILTAYIDSIRLTPDTIGVSAAYKALFDGDFNSKDSRSPENIAKAAFMAGLGQAPSSYVNDFNGLGKKRTKIVLQIMLEDSLVSNKEYKDTLQYI
ncbi:penicillin-binding protein, partial [Anaerotruncus sp. X29]|nr:penicillin-binding protein [Anaerotruncus sp. X29]